MKNETTQTTPFNIISRREAFLALTDVTQENVTEYVDAMLLALSSELISKQNFDWIVHHLYEWCDMNKIIFDISKLP